MAFAIAAYVGRYIPGLLLLLAGLAKSARMPWFASRVAAYRLLPRAAIFPMAWSIAVAEVVLGASLILGRWLIPAIAGASALLLVFTLAMIFTLLRGQRDVECGCVKSNGERVSWFTVSRNLGLITLLLWPPLASGWPNPLIIAGLGLSIGLVLLPLASRHLHRTIGSIGG